MEIVVVPFQEAKPVFLDGNTLVILWSQMQRLVEEASSRSKHRPASQRTRFEGRKIVAEYVHDVVNEFCGQTNALVLDGGRNRVEVAMLFPHLRDDPVAHGSPDRGSTPQAEHSN